MDPSLAAPAALNDLAAYRVSDSREVLAILRELRDHGAVVHLCGHGATRVMATLHAVDKDRGRLTFTGDATPEGWQAIAARASIDALAFPGPVRLQFDLPAPALVGSDAQARLDTGMPTAMFRIQRRNAFRVRTLERESPSAWFRHPRESSTEWTLRVLDLSVGGCALRVPAADVRGDGRSDVRGEARVDARVDARGDASTAARTAATFRSGQRIPGVSFDLDEQTRFACEILVHHVNVTSQGLRLGCEMLGLDGAVERALQRCIDQMQKRQRWAQALI